VFALLLTSCYNIWIGHQPKTTFCGIIIAAISILAMWVLVLWKNNVHAIKATIGNKITSFAFLFFYI
tara:strand:- start:445 stop:645 length:201 start_codon:yes stop_codon:yes gene_type:complete